MELKPAVESFFKRYTDFQGRSSRSEYWWVYLAYMIVVIGLSIVVSILTAISDILGIVANLALIVALLGIIVPMLALSFRRIHDKDKSAWWLLLSAVPLVGLIVLYWFATRGTVGPNRFGPDPLGAEAEVFA